MRYFSCCFGSSKDKRIKNRFKRNLVRINLRERFKVPQCGVLFSQSYNIKSWMDKRTWQLRSPPGNEVINVLRNCSENRQKITKQVGRTMTQGQDIETAQKSWTPRRVFFCFCQRPDASFRNGPLKFLRTKQEREKSHCFFLLTRCTPWFCVPSFAVNFFNFIIDSRFSGAWFSSFFNLFQSLQFFNRVWDFSIHFFFESAP